VIQTIEAQIAFIKSALETALGVTSGHHKNTVLRALAMIEPLKAGIQNLRASTATIDNTEPE
jgi:hypothetical protein